MRSRRHAFERRQRSRRWSPANLPDADLFYMGVGGDRLRYMLHHRRYSHTVLGAVAGVLVLWGAAAVLGGWGARQRLFSADRRWLLGLLLVSTLSHLVLDWTNSYAIHPFWPVDNRWRYGDAVFIGEPWFWVVSVPALFPATASRTARLLSGLALIGGVALAWLVALVKSGAALVLTAGAALSVLQAWLLGRNARVVLGLAGWFGVTLAMMMGTARARSFALGSARAADPADAAIHAPAAGARRREPRDPQSGPQVRTQRQNGELHLSECGKARVRGVRR